MQLQHNHQRPYECALAALCTLTDTDYATASDMFELENGAPWGAFAAQGPMAWVNFVGKYLPVDTHVLSFYLDDLGQVCDNEIKGPALLILSLGYSAHAVVLSAEGYVYDSACLKVMLLEHYRQVMLMRGARIADCIPAERILTGTDRK